MTLVNLLACFPQELKRPQENYLGAWAFVFNVDSGESVAA